MIAALFHKICRQIKINTCELPRSFKHHFCTVNLFIYNFYTFIVLFIHLRNF